MSRPTLLAGVPIVVFWAVMTGWLIQRQVAAPADRAPSPDPAAAPTETWLALHAGRPAADNRVGYVHLQQHAESRGGRDGATLRLTLVLRTRMLGRDTGLELAGWGWRDLAGERATFDFGVSAGGSDFHIAGGVADRRLRAIVESAGESIPLDLPVPGELTFAGTLGGALAMPDLEVGERSTLATFDPVTLSVGRADVRCVAREVVRVGAEPIYARVFEITASGLASRVWIDDGGEVVQAETPVGLSVRRTTAAEALLPVGATPADGSDLLALTAVQPTGARPRRGASGMTVVLSGAPLAAELPVDDTQRRLPAAASDAGARYVIAALPRGGERASATAAPPAPEHLASDAFVQASHPRIRNAAAEILAGVPNDDRSRALALHTWVFERIDKEPTLSIPSALEVLDQRRGDCNEHAVLYTALARAAGIPTRIAIGLVWSDELEGFYYHAWPEVHLDGSWRWIDPTLGQEVADATHLKLLEGGIESWPQLLPFLGKLEVLVESVW